MKGSHEGQPRRVTRKGYPEGLLERGAIRSCNQGLPERATIQSKGRHAWHDGAMKGRGDNKGRHA